jgi:hypothetical protein
MANDESCNSNNYNNIDVESTPSTLEPLLIVQAQLHQTIQQILVQMQDINQLIQSLEVRPSSRKRESNTQDDVGQEQEINATKEAIPNHIRGSTTCFKCGKVGYFALRCSQEHKDQKCYNCTEKGHYAHQCHNQQAKEKEKVHPED